MSLPGEACRPDEWGLHFVRNEKALLLSKQIVCRNEGK